MSRLFYHVMQDNLGNLLFDVSGTMRLAGTGTLATIYGDAALTVPIANPMTNHPSFGSFKCYLGAGNYDFYMAKSGYTFETLTGVQGHGTMAQQDASAVAITGGTVQASRVWAGTVLTPSVTSTLEVSFNKNTHFGMLLRHIASDTGSTAPVSFHNVAHTQIGSISTTATATAYNTTSDSRLKTAVETLTGALDVVQALRPVSFLWKADGSPGRGFLAGEVQEVIPDGVITGDRGAIDEQGNILPQQIDMSKLVVWLVGACQELAQQVQALEARCDAAGA